MAAAEEVRCGVAPMEGEADEEDIARPRRREESIRPRGQDQRRCGWHEPASSELFSCPLRHAGPTKP